MNTIPTSRAWQLIQQMEVAYTRGDYVKAQAVAEMARAYFSFPATTDDDSYAVWFTWAAVTGNAQALDFFLQTITNTTAAPVDGDIVWGWGDAGYSNAITNKALTTNVATLTTNGPHGLLVGSIVKVALTTPDAIFDGLQTVTVVPSATTFSYAHTNANVTSVAAPGTFDQRGGATAAVRHVFSANGTFHVVVTVDSAANPVVVYDANVAVPYRL